MNESMRGGFTPETPKRFSPSSEPFAVERRKGLRRAFETYQEQHPELVGLTLYGSIIKTRSEAEAIRLRESATKAKHRPDSDIDGFFFINAEQVERQTGNLEVIEYEHTAGEITNAHFRRDISQRYRAELHAAVSRELTDMSGDQVRSLNVVPVSFQIVEHLLQEWQKKVQGREQFEPSPEARRNTYLAPQIYQMFFLAIGHGLDEYRRQVLDFLSGLGARGEEMWLELITLVELNEQDATLDPRRHYPRTLEEARKMYG